MLTKTRNLNKTTELNFRVITCKNMLKSSITRTGKIIKTVLLSYNMLNLMKQ